MNPKYPIYVITRGRLKIRQTISALEKMQVPHKVVVDSDQYEQYAQVINSDRILVVPPSYYTQYNTCDRLGITKRTGPGAARNYCWDNAIENGYSYHWVMDDNISFFARMHKNITIRCWDGTPFRIMEDFCERYKNVSMAGPQYWMFAPQRRSHPPFTLNTRIYSCNLIRNDVPFRWRGRYNEDTILSLDMLKAGWCTILFYVFQQQKMSTQTLDGGNKTEFYDKEGTLPKSLMQVAVHPDVSRLVWKFHRWHHHVDYKKFKQTLTLKENIQIEKGINNYGLKLVSIDVAS